MSSATRIGCSFLETIPHPGVSVCQCRASPQGKSGDLLSLAAAADLLRLVFDKKELRSRKARIQQIVNGELTGKATKEAIEAMQAAVMVACIIPAVVATSSAAH